MAPSNCGDSAYRTSYLRSEVSPCKSQKVPSGQAWGWAGPEALMPRLSCGDLQPSSDWSGRRQWHPTPGLLTGRSHGWRSLVGCSPWGREELDTTEQLHFHFSLSCIGEASGNPLQCSCLENPRDGGAWRAAVYGVAQSWTRLKQLSSSSRNIGGTCVFLN